MVEAARLDVARNNVSPEFIAHAERRWVESLAALETAKARHRNLGKQLKSDGINVGLLKTIVSLKRVDPDDTLGEMRDFIRYARVLNLPIGQQLDLLDQDVGATDMNQRDREDQDAWDAGEKGYQAGKAGHPVTANPHMPGSLPHVSWLEGHRRGDEFRAAGGVGKRGRPKKVTDIPEGNA